jgi:signal peptidase II
MSKKSGFSYLPLILVTLVLALDICSKYLVHKYIEPMNGHALWYPYNGIGIFKNFLGIEFSITHATNRGAAWGMLANYQSWLLFFNKNKKILIPLSLVAAGALGNILDYYLYGHVIDMFHFVFWGFSCPVFNIADSAIFIGIAWIFLSSMRK